MRKGDRVEVRLIDGSTAVRRVWEAAARLVYVCSERQYELLLEGRPSAPPAIGFPIEDVRLLEEAYA